MRSPANFVDQGLVWCAAAFRRIIGSRVAMPLSITLHVFLSGLFGLAAETAQAQTLVQIREDLHQQLKAGHTALPYGRTDEAMEIIHADESRPGNLILFYTAR